MTGKRAFRRRLHQICLVFVPVPPAPQHILELGCGSGFLTEHLLRVFPESFIDAVDIAPGMIEAAQRRVLSNRVRWHVEDMLKYRTTSRYQLIASSSALHWVSQVGELAELLRTLTTPGGNLLFAVMLEGSLGELHELRREIAPEKAPKRKLPKLDVFTEALTAAGFQLTKASVLTEKVYYESGYCILRALKEMGVTGGQFSFGGKALARRELTMLAQSYERRFHEVGLGVPASYVVGFIAAQCAGKPSFSSCYGG